MRIGFISALDENLVLFRLELMKELIAQGHQVWAITPQGESSQVFLDSGIYFVPWKLNRFSLNLIKLITSTWTLRKIIKQNRLDIAHSFTPIPTLLTNLAAFSTRETKIINTISGLGIIFTENTPRYRLLRTIFKLFGRVIFKAADRVIFQNDDDLNTLCGSGVISPQKALVIKGSGVNTDHWQSTNQPIIKSNFTVLVATRAIKQKGIFEFAQAADILAHEFPNVVFSLACFPEKDHPFAISEQTLMTLKNVTYLGYVRNMKELLSNCDIFVYPSYYREGVPRALQEACSMGKPLITTTQAGCREVVEDGLNGFCVTPQSVEQLTRAIRTLLLDDDLRERFGTASRNLAIRKFDLSIINSAYINAYSQTVER